LRILVGQLKDSRLTAPVFKNMVARQESCVGSSMIHRSKQPNDYDEINDDEKDTDSVFGALVRPPTH
jgi:hypothetical protein